MGGLHPVVAIYSTFLNRAFDQLMMDVGAAQAARHHRAGPGRCHRVRRRQPQRGLGPVDPRHHPGHPGRAPRDGARLSEELGEALAVKDGPTAMRFPKGDVGEDIPAVERRGGVDVLAVPAQPA